MDTETKRQRYAQVWQNCQALTAGEQDEIAVLATVSAELFHAFPHFHWVGFYRVVSPGLLKVGPYQGAHGCLTISFDRGLCGRCASEQATQIAGDVTQIPHHIACSGSTRSEIVVPVVDSWGAVRAVLDVDSDVAEMFNAEDQSALESLAAEVGKVYAKQVS